MTACEMVRHCEARSNPVFGALHSGLLRFARKDGLRPCDGLRDGPSLRGTKQSSVRSTVLWIASLRSQ